MAQGRWSYAENITSLKQKYRTGLRIKLIPRIRNKDELWLKLVTDSNLFFAQKQLDLDANDLMSYCIIHLNYPKINQCSCQIMTNLLYNIPSILLYFGQRNYILLRIYRSYIQYILARTTFNKFYRKVKCECRQMTIFQN